MERGECYDHRDRTDCGWCHLDAELEESRRQIIEECVAALEDPTVPMTRYLVVLRELLAGAKDTG